MTPSNLPDDLREEYAEELRITRLCYEDAEKRFAPGSFGHHELIHTLFIMQSNWDDFVQRHAACVLNPEWWAEARKIADTMANLYQRVATVGVEETHE